MFTKYTRPSENESVSESVLCKGSSVKGERVDHYRLNIQAAKAVREKVVKVALGDRVAQAALEAQYQEISSKKR